jgi:HD-like signal output (HDOD) protein
MDSSPNNEPTTPHSDAVESRMKIEIRDIGIPPRPTILTQIEQETAKDEPDFIYLARLLSKDVGLSAGMIKIANSPYFSFGKKVPTVQEALLVLGLKVVVKTVAGLALKDAFKHVPNMERFWDASALTAEVAACVAKHLGRHIGIRPEDAHTFALFRDCGIPMLMIPFPEYRDVLIRANNETARPFTEVEEGAIGLNHATLGADLAEGWLLPEDTCLAIRHHHALGALDGSIELPESSRRLIAVAQLAEYLVQTHTAQSLTSEWEKLGADCLACLELSPDDLPEIGAVCATSLAG